MSKYTVTFEVDFDVEADNESEAMQEADRLFHIWECGQADTVPDHVEAVKVTPISERDS